METLLARISTALGDEGAVAIAFLLLIGYLARPCYDLWNDHRGRRRTLDAARQYLEIERLRCQIAALKKHFSLPEPEGGDAKLLPLLPQSLEMRQRKPGGYVSRLQWVLAGGLLAAVLFCLGFAFDGEKDDPSVYLGAILFSMAAATVLAPLIAAIRSNRRLPYLLGGVIAPLFLLAVVGLVAYLAFPSSIPQ